MSNLRFFTLSLFCAIFLNSGLAHAQSSSPSVISSQGLIQSANGVPAMDSIYSITVILWPDADGGIPLWQDIFQAEVRGGVFNILLGSQTPLPPSSVMDRPLVDQC